MTTKPFVARLAQPLSSGSRTPARYDAARDVGEVLIEGAWIDSVDVGTAGPTTERTDVNRETVDED